MTPDVTECSRPNGDPIATASSPTTTLLDWLSSMMGSAFGILTTAMSVSGSAPTSVALTRSPPTGVTTIELASATTWLFVMMYVPPSGVLRKATPEPLPETGTDG